MTRGIMGPYEGYIAPSYLDWYRTQTGRDCQVDDYERYDPVRESEYISMTYHPEGKTDVKKTVQERMASAA